MLIVCPECNGQVSDKAMACPHCGFRLKLSFMSRIGQFFSVGGNVFGLLFCLMGIVLPVVFFAVADGDDVMFLAAIVTVHLLPLGLAVMISAWSKWVLVPLIVLSLASCVQGTYGGVFNVSRYSHEVWAWMMFLWGFVALIDVAFLGVRLQMRNVPSTISCNGYFRQAFLRLGKTLIMLLVAFLLLCVCAEINKFLSSLFSPESYLRGVDFEDALRMRSTRTASSMMIVFPYVFCLPIIKMSSWAWGDVLRAVMRVLSISFLVLMVISHVVKCMGTHRGFASGADWTILVAMSLSALFFVFLSRKTISK